jgi:hypothetical protein
MAGGGGGAGGGGEIDTDPCGPAAVTQTAVRVPAEILILLDRSGSMGNDVDNQSCPTGAGGTAGCGPNSKWALLTPVIEEIATKTEANVSLGLKYFGDPGSASCSVGDDVAVAPGPHNAAAITAAIAAVTDPEGGFSGGSQTPTRLAVQAAVAYLNGRNSPNPKYILLVTDGLPGCGAQSATSTADDSADDVQGTILAIQDAYRAGIGTVVIGTATAGSVADATLSQMAQAGGFPRQETPSYYSVATAGELTDGVDPLIRASTEPCRIALPPPPTDDGRTGRDAIVIFADGVQVPHDTTHTEGWDYTDASDATVTIYGGACAAIETGTIRAITIEFICRGPA